MNAPSDKRPRRLPLVTRKRVERAAAKERIAARTQEGMTAAQKAFDPTFHPRSPWSARLAIVALIVLISGAVHGSVVGVGVLISGDGDDDDKRERISIEMRERVEEKPEEKKPDDKKTEEPEDAIEKTKPAEVEKKAKAPEPPPPEDLPDEKRPPPRVVGISMESTVDSGGGVSFAVGNTRAGATADVAANPEDVPKDPDAKAEIVKTPPKVVKKAAKSNRKASRIPTAKSKFVLPKRKQPSKPAYPETLKAQGIEADVPVLVSIDAAGKVTAVKILRSSGHAAFDEAARKAALAERFSPALKDGNPIPYQLSFTYRFRLEDQ